MANLGSDPLQRYLGVQALFDNQMRNALELAAFKSEDIVEQLGSKPTFGAQVRKAQIALAGQQAQLWASILDVDQAGIAAAMEGAGDSMALLTQTMLSGVGIENIGGFIQDSLTQQAREGIDNYLSRRVNGLTLSERVYRNMALAQGQIERTLNAGLILGKSAREIAKDVRSLIDPRVRGGVSYAAMRLGRTELNNAFHTTSIRLANNNPFVAGMRWHLSSSHPKADACDAYAHDSHMPKGEPGVYRKQDVPSKPHPQCFCYVVPVTVSDDEFIKNFNAGKYNDWINEMGYGGPANLTSASPALNKARKPARAKPQEPTAVTQPGFRPMDRKTAQSRTSSTRHAAGDKRNMLDAYGGSNYGAINTAMRDAGASTGRELLQQIPGVIERAIAKARATYSGQQLDRELAIIGYREQLMKGTAKVIDDINSLMEPLGHDTILYRGVNLEGPLANLKPGDSVVENAFMSTTIDPANKVLVHGIESSGGATDIWGVFELHVPKNIRGVYMEEFGMPSEREMLLQSGLRINVTGTKTVTLPNGVEQTRIVAEVSQ